MQMPTILKRMLDPSCLLTFLDSPWPMLVADRHDYGYTALLRIYSLQSSFGNYWWNTKHSMVFDTDTYYQVTSPTDSVGDQHSSPPSFAHKSQYILPTCIPRSHQKCHNVPKSYYIGKPHITTNSTAIHNGTRTSLALPGRKEETIYVSYQSKTILLLCFVL